MGAYPIVAELRCPEMESCKLALSTRSTRGAPSPKVRTRVSTRSSKPTTTSGARRTASDPVMVPASFDHDDVARHHQEVTGMGRTSDDVLVVEADALVAAEHVDGGLVGELVQAARLREHLDEAHRALELEPSIAARLTEDGHHDGGLIDGHGDVRGRDVGGEGLLQVPSERLGRLARGDDL